MKPFTDTLREIGGGKFAEELNQEFQKLVLAVKDVGRSGSLSVTIKLKPNRGGAFEIEHDYNVKSPQFERPTDIMFVTSDGALVRNNPAQGTLPLRDVTPAPSPSPPIEVVDTKTGEIRSVAA